MNIIFFGTPKFASEILKEISKKNNIHIVKLQFSIIRYHLNFSFFELYNYHIYYIFHVLLH